MTKTAKNICITAMGIALFVAFSMCLQAPVFENYYICLGYTVMTLYCYCFGPINGMIVGSLGVVLYCLLISGLRGMPGWALGNVVIGLAVGITCRITAEMKCKWLRYGLIAASVLASAPLAMLVVKSAVEAFLYAQPILLRMAKNVYAFVADAAVMIASLPICVRLEVLLKKRLEYSEESEKHLPKREKLLTESSRKGPFEKVKIPGLFNRCFALSQHQDRIRCSHLPFQDGYYVTEYDIILMVLEPASIYCLTAEGWEPHAGYAELWHDSYDMFSDIAPEIARELELDKKRVLPNPWTGEISHTKPVPILEMEKAGETDLELQEKEIHQRFALGGSVISVKDISKYMQGQCPFSAVHWKQVKEGVVMFSGTGDLEGKQETIEEGEIEDEEWYDLRHHFYNCLGEKTRMEVDWNSAFYTLVGDYFDINNWMKIVVISEDIANISRTAFFDCEEISDVYIFGKDTGIERGSFSEKVTIWSHENSRAHEYARDNGLQFKLLPNLSIDDLIKQVYSV